MIHMKMCADNPFQAWQVLQDFNKRWYVGWHATIDQIACILVEICEQVAVAGFAPKLVKCPACREIFFESDHRLSMPETDHLVKVESAVVMS